MRRQFIPGRTTWLVSFLLAEKIGRRISSFAFLREAGFNILKDEGPNFLVQPPDGWRIEEGTYENKIYDSEGILRFVDHLQGFTEGRGYLEIVA